MFKTSMLTPREDRTTAMKKAQDVANAYSQPGSRSSEGPVY